jgi:hypothetical protein
MNIESFLLAAAVGAVAAGCTADHHADEQPRSSASASSCAIALDEDVCARTFEGVGDDEQAELRRAVEAATAFARVARDARRTVDDACTGGLADLGLAATPGKDACDQLADRIAASSAWIDTTAGAPRCVSSAPPACAPSTPLRTRCEPGPVTAVPKDGAPAGTAEVAAMVARRFGAFVALRPTLASAADLSAGIAGSISAMADLPPACVPPVTGYVSQATEDLQDATTRSTRVASALGY